MCPLFGRLISAFSWLNCVLPMWDVFLFRKEGYSVLAAAHSSVSQWTEVVSLLMAVNGAAVMSTQPCTTQVSLYLEK